MPKKIDYYVIVKIVKNIGTLIFALLLPLLAGTIGSFFTIPSIDTWYATLNKPSFNPPNYIFGPVWTILYILMGISFYLVLTSNVRSGKFAVKIFLVQLVLNALWSLIFFGLHNPLFALFDIAALWVAIFFTISSFYKISKLSSYLLIPYIAWVTFATILNFSIVLLNS